MRQDGYANQDASGGKADVPPGPFLQTRIRLDGKKGFGDPRCGEDDGGEAAPRRLCQPRRVGWKGRRPTRSIPADPHQVGWEEGLWIPAAARMTGVRQHQDGYANQDASGGKADVPPGPFLQTRIRLDGKKGFGDPRCGEDDGGEGGNDWSGAAGVAGDNQKDLVRPSPRLTRRTPQRVFRVFPLSLGCSVYSGFVFVSGGTISQPLPS